MFFFIIIILCFWWSQSSIHFNLNLYRVMREFRANQNRHKVSRQDEETTTAPTTQGTPAMPLTSTLRSRHRIGNILVGSALIFLMCWSPHVICLIKSQLNPNAHSCSKSMNYFFLLLGKWNEKTFPINFDLVCLFCRLLSISVKSINILGVKS